MQEPTPAPNTPTGTPTATTSTMSSMESVDFAAPTRPCANAWPTAWE